MTRWIAVTVALLAALAACNGATTEEGAGSPTPSPPSPSPTATCEPSGTSLAVTGENISFDKDCLAAPAGQSFTIEFANMDADIPHNVAIYRSPETQDDFFKGEIFNGVETRTYQVGSFNAGTYYFQCDVHPDQMNGTFIVS